MTRWATLASALLVAVFAATGTASGADGWVTLFDGKNLDQWQGDGTATFKIEERLGDRRRQEGSEGRRILSGQQNSPTKTFSFAPSSGLAMTPTAASLSSAVFTVFNAVEG